MPNLNGRHAQLLRIKTGTSDDPDVADPTVPLPVHLVDATDPTAGGDSLGCFCWGLLAWRFANPTEPLKQIKIKVSFRNAAGVEVAGTFSAYFFQILNYNGQLEAGSAPANKRPVVEKMGDGVTDQATSQPMFERVTAGSYWGVVLSDITGVGVAKVFVHVQEWE